MGKYLAAYPGSLETIVWPKLDLFYKATCSIPALKAPSGKVLLMLSSVIPHFPRGFLLSTGPVAQPAGFVPGPLLPNFFIHPWTNIEIAGDSELFVIVLGHCVPTHPRLNSSPSDQLLSRLEQSETEFFQMLDNYSGRHAIIFGSRTNMSIVNDATGMRSVFYSTRGGLVASHAQLVEGALGNNTRKNALPFRYGFPGNLTPYESTKILTPNTYYWITAHVIRRFWPRITPTQKSADEAAAELLQASTVALRHMAKNRTVGLTLTAGLDSRTVLAVALNSGIDFHAYTYGNDPASGVDRLLARDIASRYGFEHTVVNKRLQNPALEESLEESNYFFHHAGWVGSLREYFSNPNAVAVIGNLLEIGRSNYAPARRKGAEPPITAETMAKLHHRKVGPKIAQKIRDFGPERFHRESTAAFQSLINDTGYDIVVETLDPFDQFYWEHRMGTWQGVAMGERDFYAEPFIPFNSRKIFESMQGVPTQDRHADKTVKEMIRMVDPELLEIPINPSSWPQK